MSSVSFGAEVPVDNTKIRNLFIGCQYLVDCWNDRRARQSKTGRFILALGPKSKSEPDKEVIRLVAELNNQEGNAVKMVFLTVEHSQLGDGFSGTIPEEQIITAVRLIDLLDIALILARFDPE